MVRLYSVSIFLVFTFFTQSQAYAATIKGVVLDSKTHEPLTGAIVSLKGTDYNSTAGLDGSFAIKNVPAGSYVIFSHFIGYTAFEKEILITDDQSLTETILLEENEKEL